MRLELRGIHKSIKQLKLIDLPNFTILTGVNGSGKTQLLEAISGNVISVDGVLSNNNQNMFRLFNWTNLVPNNSESISPYQLMQERTNYWASLHQQIDVYRNQFVGQLQQFINQSGSAEVFPQDIAKILLMTQEELLSKTGNAALAQQTYNWIQENRVNYDNAVDSMYSRNGPQYKQIFDFLKKNVQKPIISIDENDFYNLYAITTSPVDIFQQSFSRLFTAYEKMRVDNKFNKFLHQQEGELVNYLSDEDFVARYGDPPWDFLNSVLESANLDFRVTKPVKIKDERPYEAKLIHQRNNDELNFSDLSSGEKILMSFALCLYYAEDKRQIVQYPQVLLFDEIDAPLHPSMTQSLLTTVQSTLVEKHGIKVIMTTHSPSTVALAPESSLYVMKKDGYERVEKITKDAALAILTTGVPTLSIDYENRRQVFVESEYDVGYYEKLYNLCRSHLEPKISLTFIASGFGSQGNCDQVKHIVSSLAKGGNRNAYGVIDWDTQNQSDDRVKVLGQDKRYSIENYLLEPVLLSLLMWKDGKMDGTAFGLPDSETYKNLQIDNPKLQAMVNFVIEKFIQKYPTTELERRTCNYIGNYFVEIPTWYLEHQGHELEGKLKEVFPFLKQYQREDALKMAVIQKVLIDFPNLLSPEFVELFKEIQNYRSHP